MSDNTELTTTDEQNDPTNQPVVSGPSDGEVKDIDAVGEDHPLVAETGDTALKTQTESGAGEFLSDFIYEHDSAWVREWLQNEETACVRAAKLLIRISDEYPDGWLKISKFINEETGETVEKPDEVDGNTVVMKVPRPIDEVIEASRSLGYDPTIVWDVYRDERRIITEDNGIGMTPYEFDEAFNTIFNSGAGIDGETGGQFGVGSESSALVHGNDGGAEVETQSRRPTEDGEGYEGFRAYSYLGGANALPGEVEEGFKGTRFKIPVQEDFDLNSLQDWVEEYSEKLRVPLLYREHDAGSTPVEEEYEATKFIDDYEDPPVAVERTGEFSVVAGPDVQPRTSYHEPNPEDTFLVSMPIDRNTRTSINTFWDTVIQIHDEQGLIVAGPHRGEYRDGVADLHEDDVVLPEPTGDRDRLQRDSKSKGFFNYVQKVVKAEELSNVGDLAQRMKDAEHPADAIRDNKGDWTLFKKMVRYHGNHRVLERQKKFKEFIDDRDEFPDFDDETVKQMFGLFKEVEHCRRGASMSSKKSNRSEKPLGNIIAEEGSSEIYMAASTGGNFKDYFRVVENTHDDPEVIVVKGKRKYEPWNRLFGFKVLNEVPLTHETDEEPHDYDVPDNIHETHINKGTSDSGKADNVADRALKIRTDSSNSSIDLRLSISDAKDRLENGGTFGGHDKLILFTSSRNTENISDHYGFSKYAAIASVSKTEYDEMKGHDKVLTYKEYTEWSKSALIATEDGAMTPADLIGDDRMVILAYRPPGDQEVVKLLGDDYEQLRNYYAEDVRDQYSWAAKLDGFDGGYRGDDVGQVPDVAKDNTLFAVAGAIVLRRAEWAFDDLWNRKGYGRREISGLKLTHDKYKYETPCEWLKLDKNTTRYRLMADTPNWDDSSKIYDMMPSSRDKPKAQMYLGFHDRGIDPSQKDPEELRELIN